MLGAPELQALTLAGAFLLGAILATIATLRLLRIVAELLVGIARRQRVGGGPPGYEPAMTNTPTNPTHGQPQSEPGTPQPQPESEEEREEREERERRQS